jgi:hypothetical protein
MCSFPFTHSYSTLNSLLVIEGKGLMSKEPGVCDPYVKVFHRARGGKWALRGHVTWVEPTGPSTPVGLASFEVMATTSIIGSVGIY